MGNGERSKWKRVWKRAKKSGRRKGKEGLN
jgi:hypothetical protein